MPSNYDKTDEELLREYRKGDLSSRDTLAERYFRFRRQHARFASPDSYAYLDEWELNEAFFMAYLSAESNYVEGKASFSSYFRKVYRNEITKAVTAKMKENSHVYFLSLDQSGEDGLLSDIVADPTHLDDPKAFCDYADSLRQLNMLPKGINPKIIDVVSKLVEGYSFGEAAELAGMKRRTAEEHYRRYKKWAKQVIEEMSLK